MTNGAPSYPIAPVGGSARYAKKEISFHKIQHMQTTNPLCGVVTTNVWNVGGATFIKNTKTTRKELCNGNVGSSMEIR